MLRLYCFVSCYYLTSPCPEVTVRTKSWIKWFSSPYVHLFAYLILNHKHCQFLYPDNKFLMCLCQHPHAGSTVDCVFADILSVCPISGDPAAASSEAEQYAWLEERESKPDELVVLGAKYKGPRIVERWLANVQNILCSFCCVNIQKERDKKNKKKPQKKKEGREGSLRSHLWLNLLQFAFFFFSFWVCS